ncbi:MAG: RluA family pseudouridine synthase [Rhodospirillales bacterium]|nr:RluA family pseudouridine synthase [Rhodospirillales bacterium]
MPFCPPESIPCVTTYTVVVEPDKAGSRLDRFLADSLPDLSRTRLQSLITAGRVSHGEGTAVDPAMRVRPGQAFAVTVPPLPPEMPQPQAIPLDVVYEDEHLLVVDKPAGLVVHPGAGNPDGTLVNALLAHTGGRLSSIGAPLRPGIVHRIDKDTSGLLVVAKTDAAHRDLAVQFARHSVERTYHAIVAGQPRPPEGKIIRAIARGPDRIRMTTVERGGKSAVTYYRTMVAYGACASLVQCRLATGRTHQIRVHMAFIGHPIVGDPVYGKRGMALAQGTDGAVPRLSRQALHACLIGFRHPHTFETLRFQSAMPSDINELIKTLESL